MAAPLIWRKGNRLLGGLVLLIGVHSCILGILMLLAPRFMLGLLGFSPDTPIFFPSQSGIFLLILGICYLLALADASLLKVILISKAFAVVFLVAHAVCSAPPTIWAAALGDAAMLAATGAALARQRQLQHPAERAGVLRQHLAAGARPE